ncbi:uncharacterized protein LOC129593825 [Paramacrobiotus metropolitanus]|uniref:uncharacterized protein LOC129593825 n=1 Tax=Paramacrobiotus metropolitanus TaxID=2943436 RepID=UPI0024459BAE|nr:uncharacterized protein LOC129593825 [Paramacrobiotus metropolitanus]
MGNDDSAQPHVQVDQWYLEYIQDAISTIKKQEKSPSIFRVIQELQANADFNYDSGIFEKNLEICVAAGHLYRLPDHTATTNKFYSDILFDCADYKKQRRFTITRPDDVQNAVLCAVNELIQSQESNDVGVSFDEIHNFIMQTYIIAIPPDDLRRRMETALNKLAMLQQIIKRNRRYRLPEPPSAKPKTRKAKVLMCRPRQWYETELCAVMNKISIFAEVLPTEFFQSLENGRSACVSDTSMSSTSDSSDDSRSSSHSSSSSSRSDDSISIGSNKKLFRAFERRANSEPRAVLDIIDKAAAPVTSAPQCVVVPAKSPDPPAEPLCCLRCNKSSTTMDHFDQCHNGLLLSEQETFTLQERKARWFAVTKKDYKVRCENAGCTKQFRKSTDLYRHLKVCQFGKEVKENRAAEEITDDCHESETQIGNANADGKTNGASSNDIQSNDYAEESEKVPIQVENGEKKNSHVQFNGRKEIINSFESEERSSQSKLSTRKRNGSQNGRGKRLRKSAEKLASESEEDEQTRRARAMITCDLCNRIIHREHFLEHGEDHKTAKATQPESAQNKTKTKGGRKKKIPAGAKKTASVAGGAVTAAKQIDLLEEDRDEAPGAANETEGAQPLRTSTPDVVAMTKTVNRKRVLSASPITSADEAEVAEEIPAVINTRSSRAKKSVNTRSVANKKKIPASSSTEGTKEKAVDSVPSKKQPLLPTPPPQIPTKSNTAEKTAVLNKVQTEIKKATFFQTQLAKRQAAKSLQVAEQATDSSVNPAEILQEKSKLNCVKKLAL